MGHSSSPLIEGDYLWFTTIRYETVCLDIGPLQRGEGQPKELWKVDMIKELKVFPSDPGMAHGKTCSVAASYKDRIYVCTNNGVDEKGKVARPNAPSLVCFHKKTGKVLWQDSSPGQDILEECYSSPLVVEISGQGQVIVPQGDGWLRSFDALTGELLWTLDSNPKEIVVRDKKDPFQATPVYADGRVYIGNGHVMDSVYSGPSGLCCIDPTKKGDLSLELANAKGAGKPNPNSGVVWRFGGADPKNKKFFRGTMSTVVVSNGLVIAPDTAGFIYCLDAGTGQLYWVHDTLSAVTSSPLVVDGKIYVSTIDGQMQILSLARGKKLLGEIDMEDSVYTSPVFANGVLYVATSGTLYAITGQEQPPKKAGHWRQWRGPGRTNVATDTGLLKSWSPQGPPLLWKAAGLGRGVPSVAVTGGRIFTLGVHANEECLIALQESTGNFLWKTPIAPAMKGLTGMQWLSQRTPTVDGDRVYGFSASGVLACCDVSTGNIVWRKDYAKDLGGKSGPWGFCDYPLVDGDKLICTPGGDTATVVALDKKTGALVWKCPIAGERATYGAAVVAAIQGQRMYVHQLSKGVVGISPDGKLLWRYNKVAGGSGNVHTALVDADQIFCSCGWNVKSALLKLQLQPDGIKAEEIYATGRSLDSWLGSSVLVHGQVHTSCGKCIDWKSGKQIAKLPIPPKSTMTYADGCLYHRDGNNVVTLHEVTPTGYVKKGEFKPDRFAAPGRPVSSAPTWTFPVIAGDRLYLRDQDTLSCYYLRAKPAPHHGPDAIFVPTPQDVVEKMLALAQVKKTDVVYDLGCGDGRIVVTAAKKYGCKAVGVEIDPECVKLSQELVKKEGVGHLVAIEAKDLFTRDLSQADVVTLYLLPQLNVKLLPQLAKLKPGARIVSHAFPMEGIEPDQVVRMVSKEDGVEHTLYLWTTPLKKSK